MFFDLTSSQGIQISIFRLFAVFSLLNTVPHIAHYVKSLSEFMISFKTRLCFIYVIFFQYCFSNFGNDIMKDTEIVPASPISPVQIVLCSSIQTYQTHMWVISVRNRNPRTYSIWQNSCHWWELLSAPIYCCHIKIFLQYLVGIFSEWDEQMQLYLFKTIKPPVLHKTKTIFKKKGKKR